MVIFARQFSLCPESGQPLVNMHKLHINLMPTNWASAPNGPTTSAMKNIKMYAPIYAAILSLFAVSHFASAEAKRASSTLRRDIDRLESQCPDLRCSGLPVLLMPLDENSAFFKATNVLPTLKLAIKDIAQDEWPDSILEEPFYVANIDPQVASVEAVVRASDSNVLGYRIVYVNKAWATANCNYDDTKPETLNSCQSGFFEEIAFVSADLKSYFRDPKTMVEFFPDQP